MKPTPVALNGRFTGTPQPTGTQTAGYGLFDAIIREPRTRPVVVFADPRFLGVRDWAAIPNTTLVETPFQDWSRRRAQFWEQITFPRLARRWHCGLAHHPITTCPVWHHGVKTVVTLHDLHFYLHPEWFSRTFRFAYQIFAVPGLKRAHRVMAISNYVRQQALDYLHLRPERTGMIHNGVKPGAPGGTLAAGEHPPYVLAVGSLQPHKNLPRLIRAYQRLRLDRPELELWIVGRPQARFTQLPELTELLQSPGVKVLGYLSEADLASAYAHAEVFCYPSLLEAMQAGTLVVTSNVSCLPEIAGPACACVDPLDEAELARAMAAMLGLSAEERRERVAQGRAWTARFSWENAARAYLRLYEELDA
jgi:glycosyltransferase involved in cell wall biosynthesis